MPAGPTKTSGFDLPIVPFIQKPLPSGNVHIECPPDYYPYGNLGPAGPLVALAVDDTYVCDPANGKFFSLSSQQLLLTTLSCISNVPQDEDCGIFVEDVYYVVMDIPETIYPGSVCPSGYAAQTQQGAPMPTLICEVGSKHVFFATYSNGTKAPMADEVIKCVKIPSECVLPPSPSSKPWKNPLVPPMSTILTDGKVLIECPKEYTFVYGNLGPNGPLVDMEAYSYICDPDVGKFFVLNSSAPMELLLTTISCTDAYQLPDVMGQDCSLRVNGLYYGIDEFPTTIEAANFPCPAGSTLQDGDGAPMPSLSCEMGGNGNFFATYPNKTKAPNSGPAIFNCVANPTTTTSTTTTTTSPTTTTPTATSTTATTTVTYSKRSPCGGVGQGLIKNPELVPKGYETIAPVFDFDGSLSDVPGVITCPKHYHVYITMMEMAVFWPVNYIVCNPDNKKWEIGGAEILRDAMREFASVRIGCLRSKSGPKGTCAIGFTLPKDYSFNGYAVASSVPLKVCPDGQVPTLEGQGPIDKIWCNATKDNQALQVTFENGTTRPEIGPFTCLKKGSKPTPRTTPTTTASTTTITVPKYCPPGGMWSEWLTAVTCDPYCGGCGPAVDRWRVCMNDCGEGCPCTGKNSQSYATNTVEKGSGPCGVDLCLTHTNKCCERLIETQNDITNKTFCGDGTRVAKVTCPITPP